MIKKGSAGAPKGMQLEIAWSKNAKNQKCRQRFKAVKSIYQIAKGDNIEPKEFFKVLYQIILSTTRGPKIGPFILDIGKKNVADKISKYVK